MGRIVSLADFRTAGPVLKGEVPVLAPITRTPALAFVLALLDVLPANTSDAVTRKVLEMAERCPDCDASQEAARIAAMVVVAKGADKPPASREVVRPATRDPDNPDPILGEIALFLRDTGMAVSTFGFDAAGDPRLVGDIRQGRQLRRTTAERLRRYMRNKRDEMGVGR